MFQIENEYCRDILNIVKTNEIYLVMLPSYDTINIIKDNDNFVIREKNV